jgi:hypothetical protein
MKCHACNPEEALWNLGLTRILNIPSKLPCGPLNFVSSKVGELLKIDISDQSPEKLCILCL